MTDIIAQLDEAIEAKSLLKHPFYKAWSEGRLTIPMLQGYAAQYYHNELAFPTYLSAIHSRSSSPSIRQLILANLWDEEYGENNHPELWLRFCEALGLAREEVQRETLLPETRRLMDTYREITTSSSTAESLAAMYAYERQIPAIALTKVAGLKDFYGIDDPSSLEFFTVHMEIDPHHADAEARAIRDEAVTETEKNGVLRTAESALDAQWGFLDGAYRLSGLK